MPLPPAQAALLVERARELYRGMRERGCAIVHVTLQFSAASVRFNPYVQAVDAANTGLIPWLKTRIADHNPAGSEQAEIMPDLAPLPGEVVLDDKRRPSAFFGTTLDGVLEAHGIDTVVLAGVNTNTSIMHTAFDAFCRDLKVVVLQDCTISMYGPDLHELALRNIDYSIGWVMTWEELRSRLDRDASAPLDRGSRARS
jgi:biuret amidohydrolase